MPGCLSNPCQTATPSIQRDSTAITLFGQEPFFGDFETTRGSTIYQFLNGTVPTAAMQQGDFSSFLPTTVLRDPLNDGLPFPNNSLAGRINPVSQAVQKAFYPAPNFGNTNVYAPQNFNLPVSRPKDYADYWVLRGDHRISDKTAFYGRFTNNAVRYPYLWGALPTVGQSAFNRLNKATVVSVTHSFTPTVIFESRWGLATDEIETDPQINGADFVKQYGITGLSPNIPTNINGMTSFSISGFTGISPAYTYSHPHSQTGLPGNINQNFQQYLSWFRGRHTFKAGYELSRGYVNAFAASGSLFGSLSFTGRYTGTAGNAASSYADFLLGIPSSSSIAPPPVAQESRRWEHNFFLMDDFKVSNKLTLNLGVRYEFHPPWTENNNRMAMFDVKSGSLVIPDGGVSQVSPLFPKNYVPIVTASSLGLPGSTIVRADRNNIAPRIGIAYRPWGDKTVFRAGYGFFYNVAPVFLQSGQVSPFVVSQNAYTNPSPNPTVILPTVFPSAGTAGPSSVGLPVSFNPNITQPYTQQYNLTIEREQWNTGFRISYIGSVTRQAWWLYNYNSPVPDTRLYVNKPRPFPQYQGLNYETNGANASYNSLALEARRQMSRGLQFQSSVVWARGIYDLDMNYQGSPENPFDRKREKAVAPDIPTIRFSNNMVYQLPFGRGRYWLSSVPKLVNWAVGGWETSVTYSYYSGQRLTGFWSGPDPTGTVATTSATAPIVTIRADQVGNPNTGPKTPQNWFNVAAFKAPQTPGGFGNAAKNTIVGPHVNVWHAGLFKDILLEEKHGIRLRLEFIAANLFNHPNYNNPASTNITAANVGIITGVGGVNGGATGDDPGARQMKAGIRLRW